MTNLDELERQENEATKGPWAIQKGNAGSAHPFYIIADHLPGWKAPTDADTRLLCALRNAAPALFAELRELRKDKERLTALLKRLGDVTGFECRHGIPWARPCEECGAGAIRPGEHHAD